MTRSEAEDKIFELAKEIQKLYLEQFNAYEDEKEDTCYLDLTMDNTGYINLMSIMKSDKYVDEEFKECYTHQYLFNRHIFDCLPEVV